MQLNTFRTLFDEFKNLRSNITPVRNVITLNYSNKRKHDLILLFYSNGIPISWELYI